mmetsp:Transcript_20852/g.45206  ORF Transcript_20852/g.45206 Transcript_20852/m.45206 type:complete len:574 (+) Transcript_20852:144-1865(+)|eukprot:CAMPEP_0168785038 /NCGR_PEP_ID=MMETSP0725-20121227/10535_1 /TAXON_ID=265536 /ORGANISM="Amphiprora sp., Strain CCMP467" /LENGTH=573 /DNA_ID=CAMNT_0008835113 /DNA_START=132 /DNA_END=1853 /DNA_ORIENTATION=-
MTSITSSTTHKLKKPSNKVAIGKASGGKKTPATKRGAAPPLKPAKFLEGSSALEDFKSKDASTRQEIIQGLFRNVLGENNPAMNLDSPRAASTTRDRSAAAADIATLAKQVTGLRFVLKECGLFDEMQKILFPNGIEAVVKANLDQTEDDAELNVGLKPSRSAVSLTSLASGDDATTLTGGSGQTDSKRGKNTPPNAREGCLLFIRALCQIVGSPQVEPYVVGGFLAASLDECASANGAIRQAAQDTALAIVQVANPWATFSILRPLLLQTLQQSTEWRVKEAALQCVKECAQTKPKAVHKLVPKLIPPLTNQVWDTKPQVSKMAKSALLAVCQTNTNADVKKTIPAVVNAICKPSDNNKAISELMGTTFVVPVDASTLAILCPILARGLKEKLAIHKRAACLVISNMSKLVEKPEAVAPFGSLLVPELQKVCQNVQFQEIRDEALKALNNLTKALGDSYKITNEDDTAVNAMEAEQQRVKEEQERLRAEKEAAAAKQKEIEKKEAEERAKFKEAMDAQRELDKIEAQKEAERKKAEKAEKEKAKLSTKGRSGKCQACGLKKCPKSCVFYNKK